jgi:hypothetical protein
MTEFSDQSELSDYVTGLGKLRNDYHDLRYPQMWETQSDDRLGLDLLGPYRHAACEAANACVERTMDLAIRARHSSIAWGTETAQTERLNKKLAALIGDEDSNAQEILDAARALQEQATGEPKRILDIIVNDASEAFKAAMAFRSHLGELLGIEITEHGIGADPAPGALHTEVTETVGAQFKLLEAIDRYVGTVWLGRQQ